MPSQRDKANAHVNAPFDPVRSITDFLTNLGNMKPVTTLADLLSQGSPKPEQSPLVASPEMMQGVPGAQPMANPRAMPEQPGMMQQALRFLGL